MVRLPARGTAVFLVLPVLAFASALAPQHVHEPGPEHTHAIVHSHFSPHEHAVRPTDTVTEIEHDVEQVVYIDGSFVHVAAFRIAPALSALPLEQGAIRFAPRWTATPSDDVAPAHGPPKHSVVFRGPPALLV